MKIQNAIRINAHELMSATKSDRIEIQYTLDGQLQGFHWLYESIHHDTLYKMVKERRGIWSRRQGGWTFSDPNIALDLLSKILKKYPDWPVLENTGKVNLPFFELYISQLSIRNDLHACLVPIPLPNLPGVSVPLGEHVFQLVRGGKKQEKVGLLMGSPDEITFAVESMVKQGAICDDQLSTLWPLKTESDKLQVKVNGWAVQVQCDLSNPLHYLLAPTRDFKSERKYPKGAPVGPAWDGTIHTTRKRWPALKATILDAALEWAGDDPEFTLSVPAAFDPRLVAGWSTPAQNGFLMHEYQKIGAEFCAQRGMRAIIGDEMGVGKTVQAIAAAEASGSPRIIVICPANARYVWDSEIRGWGGSGTIQHITSQLDRLNLGARWHIVTYDLVTTRSATWQFKDEQEANAFAASFPELAKKIKKSRLGRHVLLDSALDKVPSFSSERVSAWQLFMKRLSGELSKQILSAGPLLTILDEAHRVKNKSAKRTQAIQKLADGDTKILMLTGTPLRNNEHEAAVLLSLLDTQAATDLSKDNGYTIQDIKDYLAYFMIRRTKLEVLPELPQKTRQRIDIVDLDSDQVYYMPIKYPWIRQGKAIHKR